MSARRRSPLQRCPLCDTALRHVQITTLGAVTANYPWELHAGQCTTHGWFQAEVISRPPREIFPVSRPGGTTRALEIEGHIVYALPTRWNLQNTLQSVDPYDATWWEVDWSQVEMGRPVEGRVTTNTPANNHHNDVHQHRS